jgi:hypothetical protein
LAGRAAISGCNGPEQPGRREVRRSGPLGVPDLARRLQNPPRGDRLPTMLRNLVALGQARALDGNRFSA